MRAPRRAAAARARARRWARRRPRCGTRAPRELTDAFDVVAWDLPGHGHNRSVPEEPFTMAELAAGVLSVVDDLLTQRGEPGARFHYAGDSVGGAVGLQLLLDAPDRVQDAVLLCTGARIGTPESWAERVEQVRASGTPSLVSASAERWFGAGFLERDPEQGSALLHALSDAADEGYVQVCRRARRVRRARPARPRSRLPCSRSPARRTRCARRRCCARSPTGVADGGYAELAGRRAPGPGRGARGGGPAAALALPGRAGSGRGAAGPRTCRRA